MPHDYKAPRRTNNSPIALARLEKGWTQKQLGDAIGVDSSQIAQWETGKRNPKIDALMKLGSALDVDWTTLVQNKKSPV